MSSNTLNSSCSNLFSLFNSNTLAKPPSPFRNADRVLSHEDCDDETIWRPELEPGNHTPIVASSLIRYVLSWYSRGVPKLSNSGSDNGSSEFEGSSSDSDDDESYIEFGSTKYVPKGAQVKPLKPPPNLNIQPQRPIAHWVALLFGASCSPQIIAENLKKWFQSYGGAYKQYLGTNLVNPWA